MKRRIFLRLCFFAVSSVLAMVSTWCVLNSSFGPASIWAVLAIALSYGIWPSEVSSDALGRPIARLLGLGLFILSLGWILGGVFHSPFGEDPEIGFGWAIALLRLAAPGQICSWILLWASREEQ